MSDEGDRQARIGAQLRGATAAWDPEATVRSVARPDGMLDVTIISRRFEGLDSRDREEAFWPALDPIAKADMVYLTYCLLLTSEEARQSFGAVRPSAIHDDWDE